MKKNIFLLAILFLLVNINLSAQMPSREEWERLQKESAKDHALMMEMLGISEIRPGPSGDPKAPDAANSDESKATTYTSLPDPLTFNDGTKVKTAAQWKKRRKELFELFDREVYGRMPDNIPGVTWEIVEEKAGKVGEFPVLEKELKGHVDNSSYPSINVNIQMKLTVPAEVKKPVPVVIEFGWTGPMFKMPNQPEQKDPPWQEQLLKKGWGYAILVPTSYQADFGAGFTEGIIGLVNRGKPRKLDDWGSLRAWAWGASRAVDYFESINEVDENRVVIEGLSRYGKAALVTMAYEPRIAIGFIGSSGAGGAKILRRNFGEQVENLAGSGEYHWFAPNFIKYAGPLTANDLPVDAHELIALCAPRPVFISVGSASVEGTWVDAKGMFLAGVHADPVYELLGKKPLETDRFPPEKTSLTNSDIAFRQHEGGHTVVPNWPYFIEFADRYFSGDNSIPGKKEKEPMKIALIYWLMGSAIVFIFFIVHYIEVLPFLHKKGETKIISWMPAFRYYRDVKLYGELCRKEGKPLNWYHLDIKAQTLLFLWAIAGIVMHFMFDIDVTSIF
ncbi:MAG: hypothetical protein PVG39_11090 [Desulfobacteraceae bacterium]